CINTDTVTVNVTYIEVDAGNDETICEGESVQLSVSEGASYSWMPNDGSLDDTSIQNPVATPSATTEYIVTVTDAAGCINSDTVTVNVNPLPTADAGDDQTICNGVSAQLEASGGETYIWTPDNGSLNNIAISNPLASPSTTTEYVVTVTDALGCNNTDTVTVNVTYIDVDAGNDETICEGESVQLNVTEGTSYSWIPNDGSLDNISIQNPIATPLATTEYIATVTDADGCINSDTVVVNINPLPIVDAGEDETICNGLSVQLNASGGDTYSWTPDNGSLNDINIYNPVASPNTTTTYILTVTDANNCSNTDEVTVNVTYIDVDAGDDQTICNGVSAQLEATGGETYSWTPDNGSLNNITISNPLASPSATTEYVVTVTDEFGCINTDTVTVNVTYIDVDAGNDETICEGESVQLSVSEGASYSWMPNDGSLDDTSIQNPVATPSATTEYIVSVTDADGCINSDTVTVNVNPLPTADAGEDQTVCNGLSVVLSASGGSNYSWTPEVGLSNPDMQETSASPSVTTDYIVTVTDNNGCSNTDTVTVNVTYISIDVSEDQDLCFGNSVVITANGGQSYQWMPGNHSGESFNVSPQDTTTYIVTVTDENGCINSDSVQVNILPLPTGYAGSSPEGICTGNSVVVSAFFDEGITPAVSQAYSFNGSNNFQDLNEINIPAVNSDTTIHIVLVSSNGCLSDTIYHTINLNTIDAIISQEDPITCYGESTGSASVEVTAGNTGHLFALNSGVFQEENLFTGLASGNHIITIRDAADCHFDLPFTIEQPEELILEIVSITNVNPCAGSNNGEILLQATGGTPAMTYFLNGGTGQESASFTNLPAGEFNVSVTDQNNCSAVAEATVIEPDPMNISGIQANITDNICNGKKEGAISLVQSSISGGLAPYQFTLNDTTKNIPTFNLLFSGNYSMVITDANGCTYNYPFTIGQPSPIVFHTIVTNETCENQDGSITIGSPQGGTAPYTYSLDGTVFNNTQVYTNLNSGLYNNVSVLDANGCRAGQPVTISKKPGPDAHISITDASCYGFEDGIALIDSVTGGIPIIDPVTGNPYYEYSIDQGVTWIRDSTFAELGAGSYQLLIRDEECTYIDLHPYPYWNETLEKWDTTWRSHFIVEQPEILEAETYSTPSVRNQSNGTISIINITGGTQPYYYGKDTSNYNLVTEHTSILEGYDRGFHNVFVKDTNGCEISIRTYVDQPMLIPNLITPNDDGRNDRFEIVSLPIGSEVRIYNRWGSKVYHNENYDNSWDGYGLPDGVYYYDLLLPDKRFVKGWVEIIR
ncbi:MAG: gliding motility-associated C-terminal domain-containing protein, partial [Cytophagaceae bacterium]